VGTSSILSLIPFGGPPFFNNIFLWSHVDENGCAEWELIEYMVNAFTYPLSRVIMMINLWSSDNSGSDVLDLLYIYSGNLAVRAITILLALFVLQEVLGKD